MNWTQEEWDQKIREIPVHNTDPRKWPKDVRPLSLDDVGLGIDRKGSLYWDGKPVLLRRRLELRWYELTLATLVTGATIVQAVVAVVGPWG